MADTKALPKLRPLGCLEKFFSARHSLRLFNNVACSATYIPPSTPNTSLQSLVYAALRSVVQTHPILSAIPVDEDKPTTYFARLPSVDLSKCVAFIPRTRDYDSSQSERDVDLDAVLEYEHNLDFHPQKEENEDDEEAGTQSQNVELLPFWRVVVLHSEGEAEGCETRVATGKPFVVSWVYHHALSDGQSGLHFHKTFLSHLNNPVCDVDPIVASPDTPLIPSLEELHPLPLGIGFLLKAAKHSYFGGKPPKGLFSGSKITDDPDERTTKLRSMIIPAHATKRLREISREHEASVTSTLETAVAAAVLANLGPEYLCVVANVPISFRRFLDQEKCANGLGPWVSKYVSEHQRPRVTAKSSPGGGLNRHLNGNAEAGMDGDIDNGARPKKRDEEQGKRDAADAEMVQIFSWDQARVAKKTAEKEVSKKGKDSIVGLLKRTGDMHKLLTKKYGKPREDTFEISNIGVYQAPAGVSKGWKIGRMAFTQSGNVTGAGFEVSAVTGGDGACVLAFSWLEGVVKGEWVEQVMRTLNFWIENMLSKGMLGNGAPSHIMEDGY